MFSLVLSIEIIRASVSRADTPHRDMRVSMWLVESLSRLSCLFLTCTRLESSNASDYTNSSSLPLVCWHGVNDDAQSCDQVFQTLPNDTYTLSIQIGDSLEADKYNSVFLGMMEQVEQNNDS